MSPNWMPVGYEEGGRGAGTRRRFVDVVRQANPLGNRFFPSESNWAGFDSFDSQVVSTLSNETKAVNFFQQ